MAYAYEDAIEECQARLIQHMRDIQIHTSGTTARLASFQVADGLNVKSVDVHIDYNFSQRLWDLCVVTSTKGLPSGRLVAQLCAHPDAFTEEHVRCELTALIEEAIVGQRGLPNDDLSPRPDTLTWGELRSAIAARTYMRLVQVARLLAAAQGGKAEDMREYVRTVLAHDKTLPWPVGWVGYSGPGQITACVPALLAKPTGVVHGGGFLTRHLVRPEPLRSAQQYIQRHAVDLRRVGVDAADLSVPTVLKEGFERLQWNAMVYQLSHLLASHVEYGGSIAYHTLDSLEHVPLDYWDSTTDMLARWRAVWRGMNDVHVGLRTPIDRVREALSYGPSLHGLVYATWAASAPLSWAVDAHFDGVWIHRDRMLLPYSVEAVNNAVVLPAIHVQLRQLMEVGR